MEYNSFYGGRRGASFVIVKKYASIFEMVQEFKRGGEYKTVNYDEYVLIDTVNKNDIDNGKIYRRGYDFNNELGGAIFVGQIVGPAGMAPHVEMKTIDEVQEVIDEDDLVNNTYRVTEGNYAPVDNLLPGAKGTGPEYIDEGEWETGREFDDDTDTIQYLACSVRDKNSHETTVHVGFKFPYPVIDYTAATVDPYYHRSNNTDSFTNLNLIDRQDDGSHPFYEHWDVKIPKGIKGDAFKNFRVITANASIQPYQGQQDDIAHNRKVLVYDYYHYDRDGNGEPVTLYLGDYNDIDGVNISADGTVTISYMHDDDSVFANRVKWINNVSLNTNTGRLTIDYNFPIDPVTGTSTQYTTNLDWVKDISFANDGSVTLDYTVSNDRTIDKLIKWINSVTLNAETGKFTVLYNYDSKNGQPTKYETDLRWVKDIQVANDGTITLKFSCGQDEVLTNKVKWISNTVFSPDGTMRFVYNDGSEDIYTNQVKWISQVSLSQQGRFVVKFNNGAADYVTDLRWPVRFDVNTGTVEGQGSQKLVVTYNDGTTEEIGQPLNYIIRTDIDSSYHLLALYSDPVRRAAGPNVNWDGRTDWVDLGYIGNGTGVGAVIGASSDSGVAAVAGTMPPYSGWFIVED